MANSNRLSTDARKSITNSVEALGYSIKTTRKNKDDYQGFEFTINREGHSHQVKIRVSDSEPQWDESIRHCVAYTCEKRAVKDTMFDAIGFYEEQHLMIAIEAIIRDYGI